MKTLIQESFRPTATFCDLHPDMGDLFESIRSGLQAQPKKISPMFFYDEAGLELFNRITELKEYYLTRTELGLLHRHAREMAECVGEDCTILEYGSGNSEKIKILLDALSQPHGYVALDISSRGLQVFVESMAEEYPDLDVVGVCADYTDAHKIKMDFGGSRVVAFFPGSSIGNFEPEAAEAFLRGVAGTIGRNGGMLIGVDLKKDPKILHAAYNDSLGVTAQFNLNLLRRFNREFSANFKLGDFEHLARYNEEAGRIEMYLAGKRDATVTMRGTEFSFRRGELVHTENSYKYSIEEFRGLSERAGWKSARIWTDEQNLFSIHYLEMSS